MISKWKESNQASILEQLRHIYYKFVKILFSLVRDGFQVKSLCSWGQLYLATNINDIFVSLKVQETNQKHVFPQ